MAQETLQVVSSVDTSYTQDKVLYGYKHRFNLTDEQMRKLHRFFSPTRIPTGLTRKEVEIVVLLFEVRDAARKRRLYEVPGNPSLFEFLERTILPKELQFGGRMTRKRFRTGIWKMLQSYAK
jgi:hypothetical protein